MLCLVLQIAGKGEDGLKKEQRSCVDILGERSWQFWAAETGDTWKRVLVSTVLFSLAAHGFLFTNELFSHDSISYFTYATGSVPFYIGIGRFLIPVYEGIKGAVAAPWLIGLLFMLWTALSAFLLVRLFRIRSTGGQILMSGLVCTNLALTLTGATYIYCMDEYAFALFAAVLAVCCFARGRWWPLAGLVPLAASLAVYQAYFTVAASLCLLLLLHRLVQREPVGKVFVSGACALGFLAAGFITYFGLWTLICAAAGVAKQRVGESVLGGRSLGELLDLVFRANVSYLQGLFDGSGILGWLLPAVHGLLVVILVWKLGCILADRAIQPGSRVLILLLSCLIPTAFHSAAILLAGSATELMTFAGELLYLLVIVVLEPGGSEWEEKMPLRGLAMILLCCVLWQHVVYANQVYMKKELDHQATLTLASRMIDRIEMLEGYVPGETPVAFVGRLDYNAYLNHGRAAFSNVQKTVGLWKDYGATYNMGRYLTDYLNYPLVWDTETDFSQRAEVQNMPVFPAADSIAMVDGTVVVKLS